MQLSFFIKTILIILMLVYPVLMYYGLSYFDARGVAVCLFVIMVIRTLILPQHNRFRVLGMVFVGLVVAVLGYVFNDPIYLRLYPVLMSALMLGIFSFSLISPPSVIELFARLHFKGQSMPQHVIDYTRKVTMVWCVFFILNGCVAAYTVLLPIKIWTIYNGFISYILMGSLFAIEFAYRHFVVKKRAPALNDD